MKKIINLIVLLLVFYTQQTYSQSTIFAFYEYGIKNGQETVFINGYIADLEWQKTQNDNWSWIGWFVLNGERRGRFIDATPYHQWKDFDNWIVSRSENAKHNAINFLQYTEKYSGSYRKFLPEQSVLKDSNWFKLPLVQVFNFKIKTNQNKLFEEYISFVKVAFEKLNPTFSFISMKNISGDSYLDYSIMIPLNKNEDLIILENLFEIIIAINYNEKERDEIFNKANQAIENTFNELWGYRKDLSMYYENQ